MKRFVIAAAALFVLALLSNARAVKKAAGECDLGVAVNANFSKAEALDAIMKRYCAEALPGVAMAVYTEAEGWWAGARGYADVENKVPMRNGHLQYIQSVSKTYMAVAILCLKEQGKIELDAPLTKYLPARYGGYIKDAGKITIRMLLNQTSGVPEYNSHPRFVARVLMHPDSYFSAEDCLKSIAGEEPQFAPGSRYRYTNTNYLLLALVADALTGDHAAFIQKNIFRPLGLNHSYYGNDHAYLDGLDLPESYWDVLNTGRPANFSQLQQVTVASSKGDDGIVCNPIDAVKFLKGLVEGRLLQTGSLQEMLDFVKDEKGGKRYGMGLSYIDLEGLPAYGHGGGGIGAGCALIHIPSHKTYLFVATNLGVLVEGALAKMADEMKTEILITLLR